MTDYISGLLIDSLDLEAYMILFDLLFNTDKMFQFIKQYLPDFKEIKVPLSVKYPLQ